MRVFNNIRRMAAGLFVDPMKVVGSCVLCGDDVLHRDGAGWFASGCAHFDCRESVRTNFLRKMNVERSMLSIAEIMHDWSPMLFDRLEHRMKPLVRKSTPESLCRLVTLVLKEADASPELNDVQRNALRTLLGDARAPYLSCAN